MLGEHTLWLLAVAGCRCASHPDSWVATTSQDQKSNPRLPVGHRLFSSSPYSRSSARPGTAPTRTRYVHQKRTWVSWPFRAGGFNTLVEKGQTQGTECTKLEIKRWYKFSTFKPKLIMKPGGFNTNVENKIFPKLRVVKKDSFRRVKLWLPMLAAHEAPHFCLPRAFSVSLRTSGLSCGNQPLVQLVLWVLWII